MGDLQDFHFPKVWLLCTCNLYLTCSLGGTQICSGMDHEAAFSAQVEQYLDVETLAEVLWPTNVMA